MRPLGSRVGRRSLVALGAVLLAVSLGGAPTASAQGEARVVPAGALFHQYAEGGVLRRARHRPGRFVLVLRNPAAHVGVFALRDERRSDTESLRRFVRRWDARRLNRRRPHAALVLGGGRAGGRVMLFELSRPRLRPRGGAISYRARRLSDTPAPGLASLARRAKSPAPGGFRGASLIIAAPSASCNLVFQISSAPAGQQVSAFIDTRGLSITNFLVTAPTPGQFNLSPLGGLVYFAQGGSGTATVSMNVVVSDPTVPIRGSATVPAGASLRATVSRCVTPPRTVPIRDGEFSIPLQ